jgi:hypothetical protein
MEPDRTKEYRMLRSTLKIVTAPLRLIWRVTGKPVYRRLFQMYFEAVINRLNSTLGELADLRAEVEKMRVEIVESRALNEELDRHMRTVVASHWDTTALARRLAAIEDRIFVADPSDSAQLQGRSADNGSDERVATTSHPVQQP